jgi:hypothetical protein
MSKNIRRHCRRILFSSGNQTASNARTILDFALIQSAAEYYLDKIKRPDDPADIYKYLEISVNDPEKLDVTGTEVVFPDATCFTETQAEWFSDNYESVTHYPNDASGFSCTLFRNKASGEYMLSFHDTEDHSQE